MSESGIRHWFAIVSNAPTDLLYIGEFASRHEAEREGRRRAIKIDATLHQVIDGYLARHWVNDSNKTLH